MTRYAYTARDARDRTITGFSEGMSVDDIIDRLSSKELIPVKVQELNFDGSKKEETFTEKVNAALLRLQKRVPYKSVVFFTRQLATMVEAGVPLAQALEQLAEGESVVFQKILREIADDIAMGSTFSDAIARHPGAFNNMYVSVVRSGEVAGALSEVLDQMATYMENVEAMRQKVKGALRYPVFIGAFITIMVIGILWKLVPTFEAMYKSFSAELPLATRILISMSHLIRDNFLVVILGFAGLGAGYAILMTNDRFKGIMHRLILYIPVFGMIIRKNIWATMCRTLSLLMHAGTPILQAIEICGAVVGNKTYANSLEVVHNRLRTGDLLSEALRETKVYPVLITQLVSTGEKSGRVDSLLRKAAEFYEREIRVTVDSLATIIEPFLIIFLGGIVGSILIALYLPIFMIGKLLQH